MTSNFDIYLGSDDLTQTSSLLSAALSHPPGTVYANDPYTAANIFFGFALKFGPAIEHPMNSGVIPTGEKGLWAGFGEGCSRRMNKTPEVENDRRAIKRILGYALREEGG